MRSMMLFLVAALLVGCSSAAGPSTQPTDYRVSISTASSTPGPTFVDITLVAVVRTPSGAFAHDVTVKWVGDTGSYALQTSTGADSAASNIWTIPAPNPAAYLAHMRACATDPVSRTCTVYSGTITVNMQ